MPGIKKLEPLDYTVDIDEVRRSSRRTSISWYPVSIGVLLFSDDKLFTQKCKISESFYSII